MLEGRRVQNMDAHEKPGDFSWPHGDETIILSCPACGMMHAIGVKTPRNPNHGWDWNGDKDKPTLSPSIWFSAGHAQHGKDNGCRWHGFLRDGVFHDA